MKVKAVIMRDDKTNDVVVVKKKQISGDSFRHDDSVYFLMHDRCQITWQRGSPFKLFRREYYSTYYYTRGVSSPLPVPNFDAVEEAKRDADGQIILGEDGKPVMTKVFPKVIDNGIPSEELAAIFNPWFYRIIASNQSDETKKNIQFMLVVGIALGVAYLAWQIHDLPKAVADQVVQHLQTATTTSTSAAPGPSHIGG